MCCFTLTYGGSRSIIKSKSLAGMAMDVPAGTFSSNLELKIVTTTKTTSKILRKQQKQQIILDFSCGMR